MKRIIEIIKNIASVVFSVNLGGIYMRRTESGYYQAYFKPKNPTKCINLNMNEGFKGIPSEFIKKSSLGIPPFARSSYEQRMFTWLDLNSKVKCWGSEVIQIPYINDNDEQQHIYWTDIFMQLEDNDGIVRKYIIEIKPLKKLSPPKMPKKKSAKSMFNYQNAMAEYVQNDCKWKFASRWADKHGMVFAKVSQEQLGLMDGGKVSS